MPRHRAGHIASPGGISNGLGNYGTGRDLQYGTTLTRTMRPSSDDARAIARLGWFLRLAFVLGILAVVPSPPP